MKFLAQVNEQAFRHVCSPKYQGCRTLAFYIYHMERIEDICANVLIADDRQVILESPWLQRRE